MTTPLALETIPQPLRVDAHGVVRVGRTRVTLDTVVDSRLQGARPEEIAEWYDTLDVADIYSAISYYHHHRKQVDDCLAEREREAAAIRREIETRFPREGVRERLLARLTSKQT